MKIVDGYEVPENWTDRATVALINWTVDTQNYDSRRFNRLLNYLEWREIRERGGSIPLAGTPQCAYDYACGYHE